MKNIKETIRTIINEESDYQQFFRKALEKTGKSIPDMSDEEKKAFFNKIDAAWDGKGEKNEGNAFGAAVVKAKEAGEDEFEVGGKTFKVESVNEVTLRRGLKLRMYLNGKSDIVDYELVQPNHYDAIKGGKTNLFKVVNSTNPKIKVGSTEDFSTNDIKAQVKSGIMSVLTESVNEKMDTMTKAQWNKTHKDYKSIKNGVHYVLKMTDKGTASVPVKIVEGVVGINESKFKVDDLVYNKRTKTVGIVRMGDDKYGEVKTDADGNVDVDELEKYNPIKNKTHQTAKAAPSTMREVDKRGLFNPFKNESINEAFKHIISIETPTQVLSKPIAAQIRALAKKGVRSKEIGLKMGFTGNEKLVTDRFQQVKNKIYFELDEVVNENASRTAMEIGGLTGLNKTAVQKFVDDNNLDIEKVFQFVKKGKLSQRMDFVTAVAGKTGNPIQKKLMNVFKESVNENFSTDDVTKIKGAVEGASSFMGIGAELKKLGMKYSFSTEPLPLYMIMKGSKKYVLINKRYAESPDFVIGNTAGGLLESKSVSENNMSVVWMQDHYEKGKKIKMYVVPKAKASTTASNLKNRYRDDMDTEVGIMTLDQWNKLPNSQKDLTRESVNEGVRISLVDPNTNKFVKTLSLNRTYKEAEGEVETLNKRLSTAQKDRGFYWKVTAINEAKGDYSARHGKSNILLKKGYKHHTEDELEALYDKVGKLVKGLNVKDVNVVFEEVITEALVPVDKKTVDAFFDKKPFVGKNLNSDGKVLKTVGVGSQEMFTHTPNGVKMVGKVTGRYAQSLVQYVMKNHKSDLVEFVNEGNAFGAAVTAAKKDGKTEFEFNGKTYKVKKGSYEKNEAAKKLAEKAANSVK